MSKRQIKPTAVLMTCFNRREQTLECLHRLSFQNTPIDVYLVDDGSTDGTSEAVRTKFPNTKVLLGDGNLFWVGGMHLAFEKAMEAQHEYYVWLNDDTVLYENAVHKLIDTQKALSRQGYPLSVVVGSVQDPITKQQTYGGRTKSRKWLSFKFNAVEPGTDPKVCDTLQGNIVLIPNAVVKRVGNVDSTFIHNFGDLDYGLRAQRAGCSIWVAPGYLGECSQNSVSGSWADTELSVFQRIRKVFEVKNFPIIPWTTYIKRYGGLLWFLRWPLPYLRAIIGYKDLKNSPTFKA